MKTQSTLLTIGLATTLALGAAPSQAETSLNVVGSWSSLQLHRAFEAPYWNESLPEASGGDMTANVTTHDQLGVAGNDVYNLLSQGLFDVAMTVVDYTVSDAPELEALDLPMLSQDVATARELSEAYLPIAELGMQTRFNSKVLAIVPYPQQVVFCRDEISGLEDLSGLKIRASGRSTLEFLEAAGAQALNIAFNEVPGALDRGVIDCAVTGSTSGYSSAWYEMANYLYTLPAGGWDFVLTAISRDTWNSLSQDEQQTLQASLQSDFIDPVWDNAEVDTQQGVACLTGQGQCNLGEPANMTLVRPSESDLERSRAILEETVLPGWASRVDPAVVAQWNDAVGSKIGLTAAVQ
ncbi:MAG: TRAP transporter substrate-binding protein [Saccharospirillum sp.]